MTALRHTLVDMFLPAPPGGAPLLFDDDGDDEVQFINMRWLDNLCERQHSERNNDMSPEQGDEDEESDEEAETAAKRRRIMSPIVISDDEDM